MPYISCIHTLAEAIIKLIWHFDAMHVSAAKVSENQIRN